MEALTIRLREGSRVEKKGRNHMLKRALRLIRAQEPGWEIGWLNPDIAIGSVGSAEDWQDVFDAGIRAVVDLCDEPEDLGAAVRNAGMRYLRLCLRSGPTPGPEELHIVTSWLRDRVVNEGPVFIRMVDETNNDGMLACAALIRSGLSYDLATQALERVRPKAELTFDQVGALLHFEAQMAQTEAHGT